MKVTIEQYGVKHSAKVDRDDLNVKELTALMVKAALGCGFSHEGLEEIFGNFWEVDFDEQNKSLHEYMHDNG
tara:strand:+ start:582 stop:797 length:216 start_codon:yes stop_codon:yes gene_type:complete